MKVLIKNGVDWLSTIDGHNEISPFLWTLTKDDAMVFETWDYDFTDFISALFDAGFNPLTIERA